VDDHLLTEEVNAKLFDSWLQEKTVLIAMLWRHCGFATTTQPPGVRGN